MRLISTCLTIMLVLTGARTAQAQVPVEIHKGNTYAELQDANADLHICPAEQERCAYSVPAGAALLRVVDDRGILHERTLRLDALAGTRFTVSNKNNAALYALLVGVGAVVLGYAVLFPLGLGADRDVQIPAIISGLTLGSVGTLTALVAGPIYAASGTSVSTRRIPLAPGVSLGGRF